MQHNVRHVSYLIISRLSAWSVPAVVKVFVSQIKVNKHLCDITSEIFYSHKRVKLLKLRTEKYLKHISFLS